MFNLRYQRGAPVLFTLAACGIACCLPSPSRAAVVYVEQNRRIESEVGNNPSEFFGRREQVAPDFAPFDGRVVSHFFDPEDGDEVTATITQASRLDPAGAFASGVLDTKAQGDFGRGSSLFRAVFDVTNTVHDFTLRYAVSAEGDDYGFVRSFHGAVSLQRLGGPGAAAPVVAPQEFDLWAAPGEGPAWAGDTRTGLLAPGRYSLHFDLEMFATYYEADYHANYDLALEWSDTGRPGIPGDTNGDNKVNVLDLAALRRHWHSAARDWPHGDFTADGVVDADDLLVLRRHFGESLDGVRVVSRDDLAALSAFEATVVPDPTAGLFALPGAMLLLRRRRPHRGVGVT
jgi:hypothetical protein